MGLDAVSSALTGIQAGMSDFGARAARLAASPDGGNAVADAVGLQQDKVAVGVNVAVLKKANDMNRVVLDLLA